jgi:hypothetical protein
MNDRKPVPIQPVILDAGGEPRFQMNGLVRYLLDAGSINVNDLALLPGISSEEWEQFAQLIGYSVSGFSDLSYASAEVVDEAIKQANKLTMEKRTASK